MFLKPKHKGRPADYFCGHSLGLQPALVATYLTKELDKWAMQGVEGHFEEPNPWFHYHKLLKPGLAMLCGAKETEVNAYGALSSNLHQLFISFYQPAGGRYKILAEDCGFPSDNFALQSQVKLRGFDPSAAISYLRHDGNYCYGTDYILEQIRKEKDSLALVWLSGVNFLSGQVADMEAVTVEAHKHGIKVGLDLAHAIGNIPLKLHDWGVDFAVWCSYKYLNAGPGATGGFFVHEKNFPQSKQPESLPLVLAGWWGHNEESRFRTGLDFEPLPHADAWLQSNANVLSLASLRASLDLFLKYGIEHLHSISRQHVLLAFESLQETGNTLIMTPVEQAGNMISVRIKSDGRQLINNLRESGITADFREPDILRFSYCPLYNNPEEWGRILQKLKELL